MPASAVARWRILGPALGCLLAVIPDIARANGTWDGHLSATTDYVFRGISQTRGAPAIQADLHYATANGWFAGAWASTVDPNPGPGPTVELNGYAGRAWSLGSAWGARLTAVHYAYPNDPAQLHYDYDELIATMSFRDRLAATVAWSPNTSRYGYYRLVEDRTALAYDLVGRWPLTGSLSAAAGVGYYDLDDLFDTGYGYWHASLIWSAGRLQVEAGHYSATGRAEDLFGAESTGQRWSLTATWRFREDH